MTTIRKEQLFPSSNQPGEFVTLEDVNSNIGLPVLDGSQLINLPVVDGGDADTLSGVSVGQMVRTDSSSTITTGSLTFNDNRKLKFGGSTGMTVYNDINNNFIDIAGNAKLYLRDVSTGYTPKFEFDIQSGTLSCTEISLGNKNIKWDEPSNELMFDTATGQAKLLGIENETLESNGEITLSNGLKLQWMTVLVTADDNQQFGWSSGDFTSCFGAWTAGGVIGASDSNQVVVVSFSPTAVVLNRADEINGNSITKVFGLGLK